MDIKQALEIVVEVNLGKNVQKLNLKKIKEQVFGDNFFSKREKCERGKYNPNYLSFFSK